MGNYEQLKTAVEQVIKQNGNEEITGVVLQNTLKTIISSIGANKQFVGIATPTTNPGTPDGNVFYLTSQKGIYTNFNAYNLDSDSLILFENSTGGWTAKEILKLSDPNGIVALGNTKAVSGGEVAQKTVLKSDVNIVGNVFNINNIIYDKYVGGDGTITNAIGSSYGFIDLNPNETVIKLNVPNSGGNGRRTALLDASGNILTVINNSLLEVFTVTYNENAVKLIFTIEPGNKTINVDKSKISATYDLNDNSLYSYIDEVLGSKLIASKIEENDQNVDFLNRNSNVIKETYIYNLVDPNEVHPNSTWNNGGYVDSELYHATGLIEIEDLQPLFAIGSNGNTAPVRSWRELNANGTMVRSQTSGNYGVITPEHVNTKYLIVIFWGTVPYNGLCISKTNNGYKDYTGEVESFVLKSEQNVINDNSIINKKALDDSLENIQTDYKTIVNLSNSDKILYTGSSSIESFYSPDYKAWINKLQDFIDWQIVPYGWSGQDGNSIANKLQLDTPTQVAGGVKPSEIKPTYVFLGQTLNSNEMIDDEFDTAFIESNENLLRSAVARTGAKPIIGTAYRTEFRPWIENSLKQLADKWGASFVPIGTYHRSMIRTGKFFDFYGNGHPGIRTSEAYTLPLMRYFNQLERPKQGVLIFEARNQTANISDLGYKDNCKRAEKFRSIQVGEMAIAETDQYKYDMLTSSYAINKKNISQYLQLMKGVEIQLENIVLIELIIPKTRPEKIKLNIDAQNISNFYVFNVFNQMFDSVNTLEITESKYIEFDKIKILCVGEGVKIKNIEFEVLGGIEKPKQLLNKVEPPKAGKLILQSQGFDDSNISNWDIGTNRMINLTTKFNSATFNDIPIYLGENKNIIELSDIIKREIVLSEMESFGYRKMRVWTCARINPKIYNPDEFLAWDKPEPIENPYTNVSWYGKNKYDYDDLNIILKYKGVSYENQCKSINVQKVGLFWDLGYIDIEIPIVRNGNYELQIFRGSNFNEYEMEICDVQIEIL